MNDTPPADDVREALVEAVREVYDPWTNLPERISDAILTEFEVRPRGPVTDAEVEAGAQALYAADPILYSLPEWREKIGTPKPWSALNEGTRDVYRKRARPVIEAAWGVKPTTNPGEALTFEQYIEGTE